MLFKTNTLDILKRGAVMIRFLLFVTIYAGSVMACSSSGHKSDDSDEMATEVKIDCEQEANKYRKPCRGNRW